MKNLKINSYLPQIIPSNRSNGVDRYGFSQILATRCNLKKAPRSFAHWVHGWLWNEDPDPDLLLCSKISKKNKIIVCNEREKKALKKNGFLDVDVGGLPFSYVNKQHNYRIQNSLLVLPPHSAEVEKISNSMEDYFDFMVNFKMDFEKIYVCIHYLDYDQVMHSAAESRGFKVIQGARPDDKNSLLRMRAIFDSFEYVTSNSMGSHMIYALHSGCKFSFSGPIYEFDESIFMSNGNPHGHSRNYIEKTLEIMSENYLKIKFEKFFCSHPKYGLQDLEYARHEMGVDNVLNNNEIIEYLGWTLTGQIKGYSTGAINRIIRLIQ